MHARICLLAVEAAGMMLALMNNIQSKGGQARMQALSAEERKEIAKKAAAARWKDRPVKVWKEKLLKIDVGAEEQVKWVKEAEAAGMSLTEWIRGRCGGEKILPKNCAGKQVSGKEVYTTVPMEKNSDDLPLGCIQPKWFWAYLGVEQQEQYARKMREERERVEGKRDHGEVLRKLRGEVEKVKVEVKAAVEEPPIF